MNDYAVWRDGRDSEVSSLWDQIHPNRPRDEEDEMSAASLPRMNVDPRIHPDPLSHLTQAVENIDIRHGLGREPPPHQHHYPLPPIQNLPIPNLPYPPTHPTHSHPFQPLPSNFLPFPHAPPQFFSQFYQQPPYHPHIPRQAPPLPQAQYQPPATETRPPRQPSV